MFGALTTRYLDIELESQVRPTLVATAFERFREWMLSTMQRAWHAARAKVYKEDKGPSTHLSNQYWCMYWDASDWDFLTFSITSHCGWQRFHCCDVLRILCSHCRNAMRSPITLVMTMTAPHPPHRRWLLLREHDGAPPAPASCHQGIKS